MGQAFLERFFLSLVTGAVLAASIAEVVLNGSLTTWLFVLGWIYECLGVFLVAAAELFPRFRQAGDLLLGSAGRIASRSWTWLISRAWLARLQRRRSVRETPQAGGAVAAGFPIGIDTERGFPPPETPLKERVDYLEKVVKEHDFRIMSAQDRIAQIPRDLRRELRATRTELQQQMEERVREAAEVHLAWRYAGLALLFVGLLLATAGNLV